MTSDWRLVEVGLPFKVFIYFLLTLVIQTFSPFMMQGPMEDRSFQVCATEHSSEKRFMFYLSYRNYG